MFRTMTFASIGAALVLALTSCQASSSAGAQREAISPASEHLLVGRRYSTPHATVFEAAEKALEARGYTIAERTRPGTKGHLMTAPRYAWPGCLKDQLERRYQPPGLVILLGTSREGDSTAVHLAAQTVRPVPPVVIDGDTVDIALPLQLCSITTVLGVIDSLVGR